MGARTTTEPASELDGVEARADDSRWARALATTGGRPVICGDGQSRLQVQGELSG